MSETYYSIEPASLGLVAARAKKIMETPMASLIEMKPPEPGPRRPYSVAGTVAVIPLRGIMVSFALWYDEADIGAVSDAIKTAAVDEAVASILLVVDSPGGEAAATIGLADLIAAVNQRKPITAHIAGIGTSAAYWAASQAGQVVASRMARVGSIGVALVLYDTSAQASAEGVRPVVIQSSPLKTIGAAGVPITDEMVAELQKTMDGYMDAFKAAIKTGRGIDPKAVATGQVWFAKEAKALGLIDRIASFDETLAAMIQKNATSAKARTAMAKAKTVFPG